MISFIFAVIAFAHADRRSKAIPADLIVDVIFAESDSCAVAAQIEEEPMARLIFFAFLLHQVLSRQWWTRFRDPVGLGSVEAPDARYPGE